MRCGFCISFCLVSVVSVSRAAWSKDALSDDRDDSRLLMPAGMFFVVIGGWLLSR